MVPSLFDHRLRIELMSEGGLHEVILGTAEYGNIEVLEPETTIPLILKMLRDKKDGVALTHLQVYLDRLWRMDVDRQGGDEDRIDRVTFDPSLVQSVGELEEVLADFLDEQLGLVEANLARRGVKQVKGLPLEILFALVTEDGTKRNLDPVEIQAVLPPQLGISSDDLNFCLEEFYRIRLLRRLEEQESG